MRWLGLYTNAPRAPHPDCGHNRLLGFDRPTDGHANGLLPVTDWGWQIRRARGETDLEYGYINYLLEKANIFLTNQQTDIIVGSIFGTLWLLTLFFWWRDRRLKSAA